MRALVLLALLAGHVTACSDKDPVAGCGSDERSSCALPVLVPEVGFVELGEHDYTIAGNAFSASNARLFYNFQPAIEPADNSPIFVIGGGGPVASAMFLLAFHAPNAARLDANETDASSQDKASLTPLGHLLSIDARNAGFSYSLLEEPSERAARETQFNIANYNPYRDAADTWLVLLSFFEQHPSLANHPIYFLTESYGAVRVTVMLDMLLDVARYASGLRDFAEPELFAQLLNYAQTMTVGGQILLEPWFAGTRQATLAGAEFEKPGSAMSILADELGTTYERCSSPPPGCEPYTNAIRQLAAFKRSVYDYRRGPEWLDEQVTFVSNTVTSRERLAALCGVEKASLDATLSAERNGAYRFADAGHKLFVEHGDLELLYGELEVWDSYFVPLNTEARDAFISSEADAQQVSPNRAEWGALLLNNLRSVRSFISRARYDLLIYGPALVPVLESYPVVYGASLVTASSNDANERSTDEIVVRFGDGEIRRVFSPEYLSSHSVSRDQPAQLVKDIAKFLAWGR